jgi:ribosomal protein S18 acetylase RimI-like enzyme
MNDEIAVRLGQMRDAAALADFNIAMARETEGKELSRGHVSAGVNTVMQNPAHGFYVVAERAGIIAGSLLVTREWSDWRNGEFWWIQSVYVRPELRRQGIYRKLYELVRAKAFEKGNVCGFRLYVEQGNAVAQRTYRDLGMVETVYRMYEQEL